MFEIDETGIGQRACMQNFHSYSTGGMDNDRLESRQTKFACSSQIGVKLFNLLLGRNKELRYCKRIQTLTKAKSSVFGILFCWRDPIVPLVALNIIDLADNTVLIDFRWYF